ncbi:hypothetical protein [Nonomuraea bangladeshensis]
MRVELFCEESPAASRRRRPRVRQQADELTGSFGPVTSIGIFEVLDCQAY